MEDTETATSATVTKYNLLSKDLIEPKLILKETRKQRWDRLRAEEQRLEALYASSQITYPWNNVLLTLPMSYDMEIE